MESRVRALWNDRVLRFRSDVRAIGRLDRGCGTGICLRASLEPEYLHVDFGSRSVTYQDQVVNLGHPPGFLTARNSFRADLVEIGLNYRFGR
jgi:hypothetical protein